MASVSLLCFPSLFFPVISTSIPVSAIENSVELSRESELINPLTSTTETKGPIFSFEENQEPPIANKQFQLVVRSSQDVSEFVLNLPEGVSIVEDKQSADSKFTNIEGSQWQVRTNSPQMTFSIPLVVEKAGVYEIAVGESKMTLNIQAEESQQTSEQEVTSSEEKETAKTEESTVEEEASVAREEPSSTTDTSQNDSEQVTENARSTKESSIQDVANWEEFVQAFSNKEVSTINVISDFETPNNPRPNSIATITSGASDNINATERFVYLIQDQISRKVTIEGNNHQVDFRSIMLGFDNRTADTNSPWEIELKDLEIYHGNWYGPLSLVNLSVDNQRRSSITYNNITNYGNQLLHAPFTDVYIKGQVISHQTAIYTSKFQTWRINATNQANFEVSNVTILEGATLDLKTIAAGNIDILNQGTFTMKKDSKLVAEANGFAGEIEGVNILLRNGNFILEEDAKADLRTQELRGGISMLAANSKLNIGKNSTVNIYSSGTKQNVNGVWWNPIWMNGGSSLVVDEGGSLGISATEMAASPSNLLHVNGMQRYPSVKMPP